MSFQPANELETLIYAGDGDAVLAHLEGRSAEERSALAERLAAVADLMHYWWWNRTVLHDSWGMLATDGQRDAIAIAALACAPADQASRYRLPADRVVEVAKRIRPSGIGTLARDFAARGHIAAALQLAAEGLSPYALDEEGVMQLISMPRWNHYMREYLVENREALHPVLLKIFEVEGNSEVNLAGIDKYCKTEQTWAWHLLQVCEDGWYSRTKLLACCLATLERDWPQFRAGWFSRFHDQLAPSAEEMTPHAACYLGMLQSRIPPTVTLALKACTKLFDKKVLAQSALLDALPQVMLSAVKAQVAAALKMLDSVVKRDPASAHAAAHVAIGGLQHTDPDLQQAILERIEKWGMDADACGALQGMAPFVAASIKPKLDALVLGEPVPAAAFWQDIVLPPRGKPMSALDPSRALAVPASLDDLVAMCARLIEDESDLDLFEVAFGALLRATPLSDDDRLRFAPVLKRARKVKMDVYEMKACVSSEFARLLLRLVAGEQRERAHNRAGVLGVLAERFEDASQFDLATHRGGFIDPAVLVQRAGELGAGVAQLPLRVQVRALLRLAPSDDAAILKAAEGLPVTPFSQAFCYALGGEWPRQPNEALCLAASRIRHPGADDPMAISGFGGGLPDGAVVARVDLYNELVKWEGGEFFQPRATVPEPQPAVDDILLAPYRYQGFWSDSEALILFGAALFPSSHEAVYADALPGLAHNLQYADAQWHHGAWVRLLGDPVTEMTPAATKTLALALMGKDPGRLARAVDAFVAASLDGRLDVDALGRALLELIPLEYFMATRLAASLAMSAAADPAMPPVVLSLLGRLCAVAPGGVPRDMSKLLQLMQELALQYSLRPPAADLAALERLPLSGKAQAVRRSLLDAVAAGRA
ncbi:MULTISPECIES: DUF6493 family protein [unclassified Duganella]|uniref:DUF6493 family protein n=1 Tax=unclassified Duganella TaxID=2636909 RepID=UPI0006F329CC|nr:MULTISPECIES: DUF6493 family protein [unclassified Duganella]KQV52437.1 hypothetical protein ASD07_29280 [Duganella sp. Root336D2]KRB89997.1 hypothetical protein ASE26_29080 [Duganella sp. Root198D2]